MHTPRDLNIDFVKTSAILLICIGHALHFSSGGLSNITGTWVDLFNHFLLIICLIGVNLFALSSGYILIDKQWNPSSYFKLFLQVSFYTVSIFAILYAFSYYGLISPENDLANAFVKSQLPFPIVKGYWYFQAYTVVFFCIPFLNRLINSLNKFLTTILLILLFLLFCVYQFAGNGFSPIWLSYMYCLGAYIKRYQVACHVPYKVCLIVMGISICIMHYAKQHDFPWWWHYSSSPNCLLATAWFLVTLKLRIPRNLFIARILTTTSLLSFGVYLAHVHPIMISTEAKVFPLIWSRLEHAWWGLPLIGCTIFIFGLIIDYVRLLLFRIFHLNQRIEKLISSHFNHESTRPKLPL